MQDLRMEGGQVERRKCEYRGTAGAEGVGLREGDVPLRNREGSLEGLCPLPRNFF